MLHLTSRTPHQRLRYIRAAIKAYVDLLLHTSWFEVTQVMVFGSRSSFIANDGALVMFWSDETDSCCSQKLAQIRTYDGSTWQSETNTVATRYFRSSGHGSSHQVTKRYLLHELRICGPAACTSLLSNFDGWMELWLIFQCWNQDPNCFRQYFEHCP